MIIIQDHQKTPEMLELARLGPEYVETALVMKCYARGRMNERWRSWIKLRPSFKKDREFNITDSTMKTAAKRWRNWNEHSNGGGNGEHKFISGELVPGTTVYVKIMAAIASIIHQPNRDEKE